MNTKKVKLVTFVPESHADIVRGVIGKAGGGVLGNYDNCTFSTKGIGRFRGLKGAHPKIGKVGILESVKEERIEVTVQKTKLKVVISAIKSVHPYEEIPIDIYKLL
jgi:hypothetical protein